jgi:hypothetical protein
MRAPRVGHKMFRRNETTHIEAEGFCDGTQRVSPDNRLTEIDARFAKEQQTVRHAAARPQKRLEALIETLKARAIDAEALWRKLEAATESVPPQIALPLLAVLSAAAVVPAEAVFVSPVMDGLAVTDPVEQLVFAGVLVVAASGLIKMAIHLLRKLEHPAAGSSTVRDALEPGANNGYVVATTGSSPGEALDPGANNGNVATYVGNPTVRKEAREHHADTTARATRRLAEHCASPFARALKIATSTLMILFAVSLVSVLGWWRAAELIFAGSIGGDELGKFLSENPTLTRVVITLLTIGLPVFAAIAFEYGFDSLHVAWQWRKARRARRRYGTALNTAQKELEARTAEVEHQVAALYEQCKEWRSAYLHFHELGRLVGAHRRPLRDVVLKIAAVAASVFTVWLMLDPVVSASYIESPVNRTMLAVLLTFSLGGLYAARAVKSWDRPRPEELYKHRRVIWRDDRDRQPPPSPLDHSDNGASVVDTSQPARARPVAPTWTQRARPTAQFVVPPSGGSL